jgi:hypothetical protein
MLRVGSILSFLGSLFALWAGEFSCGVYMLAARVPPEMAAACRFPRHAAYALLASYAAVILAWLLAWMNLRRSEQARTQDSASAQSPQNP